MQVAAATHLTAWLDEAIAARIFPGAVVIWQHGARHLQVARGHLTYENLTPVTSQTIYDVASLSKLWTLAAWLLISREFDIAPTRAVGNFLPAFNAGDKADIQIAHLLDHSSGIERAIQSFVPCDENNGVQVLAARCSDDWTQQLSAAPLKSAPGSEVLYSCSNYFLLARVLAKIINGNLANFITRRLIEPLYGDNETVRTTFAPCKYLQGQIAISNVPATEVPATEVVAARPAAKCPPSWTQRNLPSLESAQAESWHEVPYSRDFSRWNVNNNDLSLLKQIAPTETQSNGEILCGQIHDEAARFFGESDDDFCGNAGVFADADGVLRFARLWLHDGAYNGKQILHPRDSALCLHNSHLENAETGARRGWCWQIDTPLYMTARAPRGSIGHLGFTGPALWLHQDSQRVCIVLNNRVHPTRDGPNRFPLLRQISEEFMNF